MDYSVKEYRGYKIYHYPIVDSTNEQAKLLIDSNAALDGIAIVCDVQTKGKGRSGREWLSEPGNLFLTLICKKNVKDHKFYSFIAALSLAKIILQHSPDISVKWPNDVLLNQKKVSGILLEQYKGSLIVGIGVNINSHPEYIESLLGISATSIQANGIDLSKDDLLYKFLEEFSDVDKEFSSAGFKPVKEQLIRLSYKLGENIQVRAGQNYLTGIFKDINDEGELILQTGDEAIAINSGDVFGL